MTENHEYNAPSRGAAHWDVPLNANSETLDADVEVRDAASNRSDYTPKEGAKFVATDTGAVYVGDGSAWTLADRRVDDVRTASLSSRPRRIETIVYPDGERYVALDGHSRVASDTDATAVVEAALAHGSGLVEVAPGEYAVSGLRVPQADTAGATLAGARGDPNAGTVLKASSGDAVSVAADDATLRDLLVDASGAKAGVRNGSRAPVNLLVENVAVVGGTTAAAFDLSGGGGATVQNCRAEDAGTYGFYANADAELRFVGCTSKNATWNGFVMYDYARGFAVVGCSADGDGHSSFAASTAGAGAFVGCVARNVTSSGEAGFEAEYKAAHDTDGREKPTTNVRFAECTAIGCTRGLHVREGSANPTGIGTRDVVVRDFTAIDCGVGIHVGSAATDTWIWNPTFENCRTEIHDEGTRTRYDGVIGGGPLGGVDLSATTGQFVGDLAVSDGTSDGVSAGDPARWNGSGWEYVNRDGTVTP